MLIKNRNGLVEFIEYYLEKNKRNLKSFKKLSDSV